MIASLIPTLGFKAVWSFVKSPAGMLVVGMLALALWTTYQRHDAAQEAKAKCEARHVLAAKKEQTRQVKVSNEALERSVKRRDAMDAEIADLAKKRDEIVSEIDRKPDVKTELPASRGPCVLTESQLNRLRVIR